MSATVHRAGSSAGAATGRTATERTATGPAVPDRPVRPDGVLDPPPERTRLLDFLLGTVALLAWAPPGAPAYLGLGFVAVAGLVLLGTTRRPTFRLSEPGNGLGRLPPLVLAVLGYAVAVSVVSPDAGLNGWPRRALRLLLVVAYLLVLVAGRVHLPSVVRGMAVGLVANAVLFEAGLAPAPYGSYLSGYLLDKNVAGLAYVVVGLLLVGTVRGIRQQVLVLAGAGALVWLTGSRTSLAALGCGLIWLLLRPRLTVWGRLLLAGALVALVEFMEANYARVGVFSGRFGSDELRERIDTASWATVRDTPWTGSGLGTAYVHLQGQIFFFHNSYWGAFVEGGWVLVAAYVAVTLLVGVGLLRHRQVPRGTAAVEAANIAVLVCALRLGEVFGTTTAMTALAAGALALMTVRRSGVAGAPGTLEAPRTRGTPGVDDGDGPRLSTLAR